MADAYLPVTVCGLPAGFVFDGRHLRAKVRDYVNQGVVRIAAGPTTVNVTIDIRRPYNRPLPPGADRSAAA